MNATAFRMAAGLGLAAALVAGAGQGEEVPVCFNYGCSTLAMVRLEPHDLAQIERAFAAVDSARSEREALARAAAELYRLAARQTPIHNDRGGNIDDDGVEGRMDCIDHSTNTTTWLALVERQGWMRFHTTLGPIQRGLLLDVHWGARVAERSSGAEWVVDTWFLDPGNPAVIYSVKEWLAGARPPGTELFRFQ